MTARTHALFVVPIEEFVMDPTSLLGRFARAEEVASLVAYLASPLASATNGAALRVEGGLLRTVY
jgi:NAD(P)-dependent dehydrogenase (short-subunit alcohol dehydrogenase family)